MIHRTDPASAAVHPSGWARLPSGVEVTRLPLIDTAHAGLFARLTYADALIAAERLGARLVTPDTLRELADHGLQLLPYLGTPTAEITVEHSLRHDRDVWRQLRDLDWDSGPTSDRLPVSGAGKHWVAGAPAGRSRLMGWDRDGAGPGRALWQPLAVAHNRDHHDDGTTTMLERGERVPSTRPSGGPPPPPTVLDDRGDAVRAWQLWLNAHERTLPALVADGIHGPRTEAKASAYWQSRGLEGVAVTALGEADTVQAVASDDPPRDTLPTPLLPPISYRPDEPRQAGRVEPIGLVVIHTAECAEVETAAEDLQAWATGPQGPRASWHYAVDCDSITQTVLEADRAWAVGRGPAHERGIQIELAGRARQTPAEWADAYSSATLDLAARLTADICRRHSLPIRKLGPTELRAGDRGICGHVDVSDAWHHTTHRDPGIHFPWAAFLAAVRLYAGEVC